MTSCTSGDERETEASTIQNPKRTMFILVRERASERIDFACNTSPVFASASPGLCGPYSPGLFCALCAFLGIATTFTIINVFVFCFVVSLRLVLFCFLICYLCSLVYLLSYQPLFLSSSLLLPPGLRVALSNNVVASRPSCARVSAQPHSSTPHSPNHAPTRIATTFFPSPATWLFYFRFMLLFEGYIVDVCLCHNIIL